MRSRRFIGVLSVTTVLLMVLAAFAAVPGAGADEEVMVSIVFDDGIDSDIIDDLGGEVLAKVPYIDAVTAKVKKSDIAKLKKNSKVKMVELDYGITIDKPGKRPPKEEPSYIPPTPELQWGVDRIDADLVWAETGYSNPSSWTIAVVDTGVYTSHPDFPSGIFVSGWNFVSDTANTNDDHGHGTHCAGIIAADIDNQMTIGDDTTKGVVGVAYDVNIMPVKVLNNKGSGYSTWVAAGIIWAADHGANVISMSLGSSSPDDLIHDAIYYAIDVKNVVVVASAGNSGKGNTRLNNVGYPARYPEVIAVGAIDSKDARARFSSTGTGLDVMAPGVGVWSTYNDGKWRSMSGTSMACPHVAGTVALVLANRASTGGWTPAEIHDLLNDTSESSWTGWDKAFGYGIVDAYEAVYGS